jgi:hypothetical protein
VTKRQYSKENPSYRSPLHAIFIFVSVAIVFTALGVVLAPSSAQIGTTRSAETIPIHLAELGGFGLLLGGILLLFGGLKALPLVFLVPVLTLAMDVDHLPAYLGVAQTIRPAHSILFIIAVLAVTATTIKRLDVDLVVLSATLAHLGIDTGLFAPLSPLAFDYTQLGPYQIPFLVASVLAAVAVGAVTRREISPGQHIRKGST